MSVEDRYFAGHLLLPTLVDVGKQVERSGGRGRRLVYDCYARLSWKPDTGDLEKIEDQWEDCRAQVVRLGGVLGKRLDDGASAWRKGAKRPGWDELLARLRSGVSDGVMVWNTDRLLRAGRDLEALIDLGDKGYRVASAAGEYDLSDSDHRFVLRIKVAQAEKESDDKSRRIKRRFQGKRECGVPHPTARRFEIGRAHV